jgi:hypothetical protein
MARYIDAPIFKCSISILDTYEFDSLKAQPRIDRLVEREGLNQCRIALNQYRIAHKFSHSTFESVPHRP